MEFELLWEDRTFDRILFADLYFDDGLIAYYSELRAYDVAYDRGELRLPPVRPKPDPVNLGRTLELFQAKNDQNTIYRLKDARIFAGLSQREVAEIMNISQQAVAKIERSDSDPKLSTLRRYANAIGLQISHELVCLGNFDPRWREKEAEAEWSEKTSEQLDMSTPREPRRLTEEELANRAPGGKSAKGFL
jgi:transcriptional regulator with XRE-family HTH domain